MNNTELENTIMAIIDENTELKKRIDGCESVILELNDKITEVQDLLQFIGNSVVRINNQLDGDVPL